MQPIDGEWTPRESWTAVYSTQKSTVLSPSCRQISGHQVSLRLTLPQIVVAGSILLLTACGRQSGAPPDKAPITQPVQVSVSTAISRHASVTIQATGSFVAVESSDVAPQTSGFVVATPIDAGAFVQQGAVIAKLDERDAKLRLQQARASEQQGEAAVRQARSRIGLSPGTNFDPGVVPEVQAAEAAYESAVANSKLAAADAKRYASLVATGDVSQSTYEKQRTAAETAESQANAARKQYQAAVNTAKQSFQGIGTSQASLEGVRAQTALAGKALSDTVIRAPITGHVSARLVSVGEYVTPSAKIATIVRASPIRLHLLIPESEAAQVQPGMDVLARVAAYRDRQFKGAVYVINPVVDPVSRSLTIEAEFPNPRLDLRPGMFAEAQIVLTARVEAVFIPQAALANDPVTKSSRVFLVRDNTARVQVVQAGETEGAMVRILSGLKQGDVVATSNVQQLYDGGAVRTR